MYRADCIDKGRDQDKTSCDYTAHRRIDAGADGLNGPADEIKYTQYLQLYIKSVFWFDYSYRDL